MGDLNKHMETFISIKAVISCSCLCGSGRKCLVWIWDEGKGLCYLSLWMTVGREAAGLRFGLNVDRFRDLQVADECR